MPRQNTQLESEGAEFLVSVLGHSRIRTTQTYCTVSNLKVQRDYFKAMKVITLEEGGERVMT